MTHQLVQFHARQHTKQDNIGTLIICHETGICIAIDAPDAKAIEDALTAQNMRLTHILMTHAHHDHIDGLNALCERYNPQIIAGALTAQELSAKNLPCAHQIIHDQQEFHIGSFTVKALHTPGHRDDHMAYWFEKQRLAVCGDVLFKMGCGRAISGQEHILWRSIERIKHLPDHTALICGHDYCEANVHFALALEPHSSALQALLKTAQDDKAHARLTAITTLTDEKQHNPFLRTHDEALKRALNLPEAATDEETFIAMRLRKNVF